MDENKNGCYIAIKWESDCVNRLINLCEIMKIPNIVPKNKMHTTIIYDINASLEGVTVDTQSSYNALISKLDIFTSGSGNKCLVAILNCPELNNRFTELSEKYGFKSDYPEYHAHITLSYSLEDWDDFYTLDTYIQSANKLFQMTSTGEYIEPINLNFTDELSND